MLDSVKDRIVNLQLRVTLKIVIQVRKHLVKVSGVLVLTALRLPLIFSLIQDRLSL
jgi:hypothetical protein